MPLVGFIGLLGHISSVTGWLAGAFFRHWPRRSSSSSLTPLSANAATAGMPRPPVIIIGQYQ